MYTGNSGAHLGSRPDYRGPKRALPLFCSDPLFTDMSQEPGPHCWDTGLLGGLGEACSSTSSYEVGNCVLGPPPLSSLGPPVVVVVVVRGVGDHGASRAAWRGPRLTSQA